ncbi:MAG: ABC transporter permease [Kofleriaceae bacterium]|nr:ABC transporter permease [Kofleriaceae bacterium]MBP9172539.1 ABC transporter permease [Kofleriaceae bacterium]MBP9861553.1 ABC transporter permease [Kofleriaceae bacterium]
MNLTRTTAIAVTALGRAKVRSLLTVLGVVIGVAAVIAMVAIGEGAKARVAQQFQAMGTSTLIVTSGASTAGGARGGAGSKPTLTWDDLNAIAALPEVAAAAPQLRAGAQVVTDLANWQTQITATTPAWFTIRSWAVTRGAALTEADVAGARRVAVLGQTVVTNLFPDVDPIGQTVRIDRTPYTVIGVLARQGTSGFGQDNDDVVVVPSTTFVRKVGGNARYVNGQVMVMAAGRDQTAETKVAIEELLRTRHQLRADAADDFTVRDLTQVADAMKASTATITSLLAGVALVSLLVGGIGIMNVMLVSVTERTREIGLRLAIGARPRHLRQQFLVEAILLSSAGGVLGIAVGVAAGRTMAARFGFPLLVRADVVVLAVVVAATVGVVFGWYPARRASRLDPIVALRHE